MAGGHWQHFDHQADIGIRGTGATLGEAFAQAACALTAVVTDPDRITPSTARHIQCHAPDLEMLFVDWINALIYAMTTERMLFSRFDVSINDHHLQAIAKGEKINLNRHRPAVEVKGATYTELHVCRQEDGSWCAQCVVDV